MEKKKKKKGKVDEIAQKSEIRKKGGEQWVDWIDYIRSLTIIRRATASTKNRQKQRKKGRGWGGKWNYKREVGRGKEKRYLRDRAV